MSYYDNNLWFRSYQGGGTYQPWEVAIGSGGSNQTKTGFLQSNDSLRAPIFYDSNNTAYYCDPNSVSRLVEVQSDRTYGFTDIRSPIFYDYNNTGYYVDPASTTNINYVYANRVIINSSNNCYIEGDGSGIALVGSGYFYVPASGGMYVQGILRVRNYLEDDQKSYLDIKGGASTNYTYFRGNIGIGVTGPSYAVHASGTIYATGDVIAYSDKRKKENIETVSNPIDKLLGLRGVYYNRIDDDSKTRQIGVIAQETLEVLPEVVQYTKDYDEYGVKYGNFAGLFIEGFKAQQELIVSQQKQIDELKEIISNLVKK
jgi:hypothetical protein